MTGKHIELKKGETFAIGDVPEGLSETLMIDFHERETAEPVGIEYFKVAGTDAEFEGLPQYKVYAATIYYFVVPDDAALDGLWALQEKAYGERGGSSIEWYAYLDTGASAEGRICASAATTRRVLRAVLHLRYVGQGAEQSGFCWHRLRQ